MGNAVATMLLAIFMATAGVATSGVATAGAQSQKDQLSTMTQQQLDVTKVLLKQERAWNRGDIDGFADGYKDSPETLFIGASGIQRGFVSMKENYKRNYPTKEAMGQLTFSELEVHTIDEKVAVCIGRFKLERSKKNGGNAEGLFTLIFEKTESGWKIVVDHTT
jgi:ketosteroid isomerase-like protein